MSRKSRALPPIPFRRFTSSPEAIRSVVWPAGRDRRAAEYARAYRATILGYRDLATFLTWGLYDRSSRLADVMPRADGRHERDCPRDDAFAPKPPRYILAAAFAAAPLRMPV